MELRFFVNDVFDFDFEQKRPKLTREKEKKNILCRPEWGVAGPEREARLGDLDVVAPRAALLVEVHRHARNSRRDEEHRDAHEPLGARPDLVGVLHHNTTSQPTNNQSINEARGVVVVPPTTNLVELHGDDAVAVAVGGGGRAVGVGGAAVGPDVALGVDAHERLALALLGQVPVLDGHHLGRVLHYGRHTTQHTQHTTHTQRIDVSTVTRELTKK